MGFNIDQTNASSYIYNPINNETTGTCSSQGTLNTIPSSIQLGWYVNWQAPYILYSFSFKDGIELGIPGNNFILQNRKLNSIQYATYF